MESYQVTVTRNEDIGDTIEFCLKQDITIGTLKELMSLRIPYHPPSNELAILFHGLPCADDTYISVFVS